MDRDPDAFKVLLSAIRSGPGCGCSILPRSDSSLCARVLRDAEYFGVDWLLEEVKCRAQRNVHAGEEEEEYDGTAAGFDEEHGSITDALDSGVLPDRIFGPPPLPKARQVKQLLPAAAGAHIAFRSADSGLGYSRKIACYALIESAEGAFAIEPVIARRPTLLESADVERPEHPTHWYENEDADDPDPKLMLASEWIDLQSGVSAWAVKPNEAVDHDELQLHSEDE